MKPLVSIISVGLLAVGVASAKDNKKKVSAENKKLEATWQVVSWERQGEKVQDAERFVLVIDGDSLALKQGDLVIMEGKIELDSTKKTKRLDLAVSADKERVSRGIYSIEGDTLKWCNAAPGVDDRPEKFETTTEKNHMLMVLKREKKAGTGKDEKKKKKK